MAAQRTYLAIDLKSFYASVECVDRHLDPLTTNLVVADASRTEKTICLAVSPSLKAYKIPGRARLFEAVQRVKEVNAQRLQTAIRQQKAVRGEDGKYHFASTSFDANALNADPTLGLSYIVAPPRMQRYLDVSTQIYKTYLKYVSPADIYPYSIDEVFIDVTGYLPYYHMSAHELAMTMVREVLYNTGITATAGIGTNLYLAKLAMDIVAKHIPADKDGVRIAELDEQSYRYLLWNHRPLTDFWMTGPGTVKRLEAHGIYTMGDLARFSIQGEDRLYEIFGVDAEILIDHAWGYEPCGMEQIKSYKPSSNSISEGQVLSTPYLYDKAKENMEKQMREEILKNQCEYYIRQNRESKEWWEELRKLRHNMKQHYILENTYLEKEDYEALKRYCSENLKFLDKKDFISNSGNLYIDSVVNYKADMAEKAGIKVIANTEVPQDAEMNAEDISICLGNLLDNAIEAVKELTEDRVIRLWITTDGNNIAISIKNRYKNALHKSGGRYLTSKEDDRMHGIGLSIVRQIVDQYAGEMEIREEDNVFDVMILMYDFLT